MKSFFTFLSIISFSALIGQSTDRPDALMLRFPDVSQSEITFVYAEDIWVVPIEGGLARRITSTKGMEMFPRFSPDGKTIAFTGNYDGNNDVYTITHDGFGLRRLTYHPGTDLVVDWHPEGDKVLFASRRKSPSMRFNQFYTIGLNDANPEQLPLFFAELGSYSPDGKKLAYQYLNRVFRTWKRYQGGTASDVLIYNFETGKSTQITQYKGTDALPMWNGDKIYFLSDRGDNHKANIWSYDTKTETFKQETFFDEYDVKFPSVGPGHIVFENGGRLMLLDLNTGKTREVNIRVPSEHIQARPTWKDVKKYVRNFGISPTGKRAVFDARGDIYTVPAEKGITLNLTRSSGASQHSPAWSPDGKYIAYFSDETGEYQLMLKAADGKSDAQALTTDLKAYYSGIVWSPDSKKIAFRKYVGTVYYIDVNTKKIVRVDKGEMNRISDYTWSPDSKWLAYSKADESQHGIITVYNLEDGTTHGLTSVFYDCSSPAFSKDGNYLFYVSSRAFAPVYSDFDGTWVYNRSYVLMAASLRKDTPSIIAPENDVEEVKTDGDSKAKDSKKDKKKKKDDKAGDNEENPVKIDFDGFEKRAVVLPPKPGYYYGLAAIEGKLIYAYLENNREFNVILKYWDIEEREEKTVIEGITGLDISADGKKFIYRSKTGGFAIADLRANQKQGEGTLDLSGLKAEIDPRKEWTQIFYEAWRLERDFFYDPNMHGVDWNAVKERYARLLPYVSSRSDLNYIIGEMIGELNVGHAYVGGGDLERADRIQTGLLGADISATSKGIRIDKIYEGARWDMERSPLRAPAVDVNEGDYIVAVNHVKVDPEANPYAAFENFGGKTVTISVSASGSMSDARDFDITLLNSEARLRNLAWIEMNRKKVFEATDGLVGYIYVPNTGISGQTELVRMYQGQQHMHGLIIDERWNSGGQIPDRFVELLNRPIRSHFSRRDLKPMTIPFNGMDGPRIMLANQWAGSGGDMFPYIFKQEKVGPVVGKRTWGGLVGISGIPPLVDRGFLTAPNFAFFNLDGEWDVEGYGVDPDYEVDNMPEDVYRGYDAQLEKAIELAKKYLEEHPPKEVKVPAFPDKTGIGNN